MKRLDKKGLAHNFGKAASQYDEVAVIQRIMADRLLERLSFFKLKPLRILDVGSGTGYCSIKLKKHYPKAEIVALDIALPMLVHHKKSQFWTRRQRYVCADAEKMPFQTASFDLIFSNCTLQWCENPLPVFQEFRRLLKPEGLLLFTSFGPDTLHELRACFATIDSEPHVNSFIDLHDLGDDMIKSGLSDPVMDMEMIVLTYQNALDVMHDLKKLGAQNTYPGRARGLMGKARLQKVIAHYETFRREDQTLPLHFEALYGHAFAPRASKEKFADKDGTIRFSLDDIQIG